MNILAFDTSTEKFSICILKNNRVVLNLSKILNKTYSKFLIPILKNARDSKHEGPILIHIKTKKGKGFKPVKTRKESRKSQKKESKQSNNRNPKE